MPEQIAAAIEEAYRRLSGDTIERPVAVRSSATGEDTAEASFAGMNETFLNMSGASAVVDAVRRCWRSLYGSRTIYYRARNGLPQTAMDIAVVVQLQIASTRAGVMFTANPASGSLEEIVIEGSFGLGEAVVSGAVSPDRYLVEKATLAIRRREVHDKELAIESADGGGTIERALTGQERKQPVLTDEEITAVAELGRRIEQHYREPQDTEWAFDPDGALWMLQSRPITTLGATASQPSEPHEDGAVLLRGLGGAPGRAAGRGADPAHARRCRNSQRRRHSRHAHDVAGLDRAHAPCRGHRHRLRRHDVPRRDRLARVGHPVRRRHRRSHAGAPRRRGRSRSTRRAGWCSRAPPPSPRPLPPLLARLRWERAPSPARSSWSTSLSLPRSTG